MKKETQSELGIGNLNSLKKMNDQKHKHEFSVPRREKPHVAIITLKVDVRGYNADNTLDAYVLGRGDLEKYGISNKAQIVIKGADEAQCVQKVKNLLENLHVDARK